jgi:hypothetical protein
VFPSHEEGTSIVVMRDDAAPSGSMAGSRMEGNHRKQMEGGSFRYVAVAPTAAQQPCTKKKDCDDSRARAEGLISGAQRKLRW